MAAYTTIGFLIVFGSNSGCSTRGKTEEAKAPASTNKPTIRPLSDVVFERTEVRRERGKYLTEGLLQCFICHTDRDWKAPGAPPLEGRKGSGHVWSAGSLRIDQIPPRRFDTGARAIQEWRGIDAHEKHQYHQVDQVKREYGG